MPTTSVTIALDRFTTFGDLLRYLRRRAGLTQRQLSIAVGYSDAQISRLERNERLPDLATVTARFLAALDIEDQPEMGTRLLELAASLRREDAPAIGLAPYKGLRYFDETDAELFFGREALTDLLLERLYEQLDSDCRFLAIVGASGSGKSSLVRAGLIPALHWRQPSSGWPMFVMTPTAHPLDALAAAIHREAQYGPSARKLIEDLAQDVEALHGSLRRAAETVGAAHAILVVDQFEELFTLCRSKAEQATFVESLMRAASHPGEVGMVVTALRADFYAHCAHFDALRQALSRHQVYIGPMTAEELRRAIEEPARHEHWELEPGLVDVLLHDVGADVGHTPEPGALPLLSHALLATWQQRRGRTMTLSGYTASGGVRGAIAQTAEAVFYDQLEPEERDVARQIFLRLTGLGGETSTADTRRRVSFDELVSKPDDRELVRDVLLTLADARLITTDQETVEVAHEALIREWPTLRGWLEEDREGLLLHRRLTEAAQEWDALGRDLGSLYRGARLGQALEWATSHPDDVNVLERAFLEASQSLLEKENREREAQRQRELEAARRLAETARARAEEQSHASRRLRQRAVFLLVALMVAGALAVSALVFWRRAIQANRLATSRELAAAAISNLDVDPERSVLLALHGLEEANTLEARNALHRAVPELHIVWNRPAHEVGVPDVAYSPDGTLLASLGAIGEVKVWDPDSGELLFSLDAGMDEFGSSVAFSPDGGTLAEALQTRVVLWDIQRREIASTLEGRSIGTTVGYNLGVGQISFSPDGRRLAVANMDGVPKVWELATQREILSLAGETLPSKAIAHSPDGRLLATGGDEGLVRVWDAGDGAEIYVLPLGGIIHSVSFSTDGTRLAAASEDGSVKVWVSGTGEQVLSLPRLSGLYDIAFLADGTFATAGQDGTIRVWDPLFGQELLTLAGATSTVISVAGSPDGRHIASGAYDGSLRVWDGSPGRELTTMHGHSAIVWNVAYAPDGSRLVSVSVDGSGKIWDAKSGTLSLTFPQGGDPTDGFTGLAISPDGSRVATGSTSGAIQVWDGQTGVPLTTLKGHANYVVGLAFSPDGTRLASSGWDGSASVWGLGSSDELSTFSGHAPSAMVSGLAFSPDGETVFTGADDTFVYQWDATTGQQLRSFAGGRELFGIALSPDGSLLAAGDQDGNISLWEVASGERRHALSGHAGIVLRLAFSQDGSRLASASFDRLAKVWDVETGSELVSLYGNASNVFGVAFSPDGERLATAGADGSVRTYTLQLDELIELADARVTRALTDAECRKFLHVDTCP
ncbi:MAG: helix-turn-helix domain-containing protein [Anaerolineae bacterium]|jgi:WD40 repeat protein/transcriptional regulator with XRE-family HTH domain